MCAFGLKISHWHNERSRRDEVRKVCPVTTLGVLAKVIDEVDDLTGVTIEVFATSRRRRIDVIWVARQL